MSYSNNKRSSYSDQNKPQRNELLVLEKVTRHLVGLRNDFQTAAAWNPSIEFEKESVYAKNIINNNPYLTDLANQNLKSFEVAFLQLATSGLTLDPSQKLAYLVPRNQRVFLDVSYLGLIRMATDEGLCEDIVVELVFDKDTFKSNGRRQSPEHHFDPFADQGPLILTTDDVGEPGERGNFRGVYVDYRMKDGRNLVYFLTKSDLAAARAVSESWKKLEKRAYSPWTTFPWKMVLKSAIKQTIYQIPGNRTRTSSIIAYLNNEGGEGFRDVNAMPIQTAEIEMNARNAAKQHDVHSTQPASANEVIDPESRTYEGEVISKAETVQENKADNTPDKTPVESDSSNDAEHNVQPEEMSEIPGVRAPVLRRINKLVTRSKKTLAFETMISDVRTAFQFNDSEIAYAIRSIEQARRSIYQDHLIAAVNNCDFTDVEAFIGRLADGEFKDNAITFTNSLQLTTARLRDMYDESVRTNNFEELKSEVERIEFEPLKKVLTNMLNPEKAA